MCTLRLLIDETCESGGLVSYLYSRLVQMSHASSEPVLVEHENQDISVTQASHQRQNQEQQKPESAAIVVQSARFRHGRASPCEG